MYLENSVVHIMFSLVTLNGRVFASLHAQDVPQNHLLSFAKVFSVDA